MIDQTRSCIYIRLKKLYCKLELGAVFGYLRVAINQLVRDLETYVTIFYDFLYELF